MKRILFFLLLSIFAFPLELDAQRKKSSDVYVKAYYRADGTYVKGHYRSAPNSTNRDNFSTRGNVNPYTGKPGTVDPDNKTYYYTGNNTRVLSNTSSSKSNNSKNQSNTDSFKSKPFIDSQYEASYFFALNNRYIGLENPIRFSEDGFDRNHLIDLNFGIESNGGALLEVTERTYKDYYRKRPYGDLVIYLEDGSTIVCYDRKLYDKINDYYVTYYSVTPNEIKRLQNFDIQAIQIKLHDLQVYPYSRDKVIVEPEKKGSKLVYFTSSWINLLYRNYYN